MINKYLAYLAGKITSTNPSYRPIVIGKKQASEIHFCFTGEFGYELISWIPYLLFLKKKLGIPMRTMSRPGSAIFYYFSDDHLEVEPTDISYVWGDLKKYKLLQQKHSDKKLIFPHGFDMTSKQSINIGGYEWENKNIHENIKEKNYLKPDYSFVKGGLPFKTTLPTVVINNKYTRESGREPVNFFDRKALVSLRQYLAKRGYFTVYNRFIEETSVDEYRHLNDENIFTSKNTYDMRRYYRQFKDVAQRNRVQLALFNQAKFVIAVQGGNVYLPAICHRNIFLLMRMGVYLDYLELARLYKFKLEAFYEPEHLLSVLQKKL